MTPSPCFKSSDFLINKQFLHTGLSFKIIIIIKIKTKA
jgi:hypothetical protein